MNTVSVVHSVLPATPKERSTKVPIRLDAFADDTDSVIASEPIGDDVLSVEFFPSELNYLFYFYWNGVQVSDVEGVVSPKLGNATFGFSGPVLNVTFTIEQLGYGVSADLIITPSS